MDDKKPIAVGCRIMHNGDRGVVRYYGGVQGHDGNWYGIQWDNAQKRGRHDGMVANTKYFEVSTPKSASFIRESEDVSAGEDLVPLIYDRYSGLATKYVAVVDKKDIEIESEEKNTNNPMSVKFSHMRAVNFDHNPVAVCRIMDITFPACKDLTLSHTLLSQWSEVFKMISLFPNLQYLDISDNLLQKLSEINCDEIATVNSIQTLHVNKCNLDDESAYRLLLIFPNIRDLSLTRNKLKSLSVPSNYPSLEILHLQQNDFCSLDNLKSLAKLPNLKHLDISDCNISKITVSQPFEKLEKLIADNNKFTQWDDIKELTKFPSLKQLVMHARLPTPPGIHVREIMIAKFPNLTFLDRLDVSAVYLRNCEYDFLRKVGSLQPIPPYFQDDIKRLKAKYPEFQTPTTEEAKPEAVDETVHLRFIHGDTTYEKTFDNSQDLLQIIKTVCRKMKLPSRGVEVYIRRYDNSHQDGQIEEHVTYLNMNVKSYDFDENSTVVLKVSN